MCASCNALAKPCSNVFWQKNNMNWSAFYRTYMLTQAIVGAEPLGLKCFHGSLNFTPKTLDHDHCRLRSVYGILGFYRFKHRHPQYCQQSPGGSHCAQGGVDEFYY